jgi:hypothetical protein
LLFALLVSSSVAPGEGMKATAFGDFRPPVKYCARLSAAA